MTGTPTVTITPSGELTASDIAIPSSDFAGAGNAFDGGRGVTARLAGGVEFTDYKVTIVATTTSGSTLARTFICEVYGAASWDACPG